MTPRAIKLLAGGAVAPLVCGVMAGPAWAANAAPAGNNGTIKVDGQPLDQGHDNEPHPGCTFRITMFGFDAGTDAVDVAFALQPPSGTKPLLHDQFSFTANRNRGGATYDGASPVYDLAQVLSGVTASKQGFHVKVSVSVNGGNAKHKVFWVQPCTGSVAPAAANRALAPSAAAADSARPSATVAAAAVSAPTVTATTAGGPDEAAVSMAATGTVAAGTAVLGEQIERPVQAVGAASASRSATLPFTGFDAALWSLLGVGAVGAGILLVRRAGRSAASG